MSTLLILLKDKSIVLLYLVPEKPAGMVGTLRLSRCPTCYSLALDSPIHTSNTTADQPRSKLLIAHLVLAFHNRSSGIRS
jgi:hypothetical protein